ncbi:ABC transporter substrate-binding protein [Cecembia calidifontis]|jgi:iron complex transport system substrate-binding protein|uniref:Iron complex transport system substrate-binding protein n=1 Tax=Cecembia calidifontis TaxID=1187080 RepID=A0A4Q7PAN1_9BACT|nr:ABC transporter substrate-binding protein [Cecembia calidifontis]RZS96600.1 iron complex transport system substrate-binding protein [Cecembia calidifontis]
MKALFSNKQSIFFLLFLALLSCQHAEQKTDLDYKLLELDYAEGFKVYQGIGFKVLEVLQAFPGKHQPFRYLVMEQQGEIPKGKFDAIIQLPVKKVILTSTTQIPHLEYLGESSTLIGFPNLDLISSEKVRKMIHLGKVKDLGKGAQTNVEMVIDLAPDWIMISTLGEDLRNLDLFQKSGIPAPLNGEYLEGHPLGRAEWIKFTGALLGRWEEAHQAFEAIKNAYEEAEALAKKNDQTHKPKIMSGVMYKDIWYVPGADSWGAKLIQAAGGDYGFKDHPGTGSIQLSYEYVFEKAQDADFWIGAADHNSLEEMGKADPRYTYFQAFQKGQVYTYTKKKGIKGGVEYFELGYLRPDLILKDLIKIMYPDILPDYTPYFYSRLNEK